LDSRLCLISGPEAETTACLLSQILARRGRTAMYALERGAEGELAPWLEALAGRGCRFGVCALPEGERPDWYPSARCAVFLDRSAGEAAAGRLAAGADVILSLDDPEGLPPLVRQGGLCSGRLLRGGAGPEKGEGQVVRPQLL